ncbi:MAG: universal stress protein [Cyanobacteria bacterium P01_F01_bin.53]
MKILVAVDLATHPATDLATHPATHLAVILAEATEKIVGKVESLALALPAEVWVLHVALPDPDFVGYKAGPQSERDFLAKKFHEEHRQVQSISSRLQEKGIVATALLVQGATVETIIKEASKLAVDMIVVGSHGRGMMAQLLIGSVSQGVLQQAKCPVLVIPTNKRA